VHSIQLQSLLTFFVHSKNVYSNKLCNNGDKVFVSGPFEEEMNQINIYLRSTRSRHLVIPAVFLIPACNPTYLVWLLGDRNQHFIMNKTVSSVVGLLLSNLLRQSDHCAMPQRKF
jgi:hypothetical protein